MALAIVGDRGLDGPDSVADFMGGTVEARARADRLRDSLQRHQDSGN